MCGFASIFAYNDVAPPIGREELLRIRDRMTSRGPDGCGEYFSADGRVGLGHRRLSIIDLSSNGAQPMANCDGSLVIVFNGEIYNYRELRHGLEQKGYRFRSTSDTEVLLHLYADKGRGFVHDLRGMYAFVIWDEQNRGIFLARDPFGIKPLYYADDGRTVRAASQVKALVAGGMVDTSPEPAGHVGFFLWGHVPEPYTLYKGIRSLPAGTSLWVDATGKRESHSFTCISEELAKSRIETPQDDDRSRSLLHSELVDSLRCHLVADVPVGIFLSSGLDSCSLAALAAEAGQTDIHTVTLGFREYRNTPADEVPLAEAMARHIGATHRTIWVERHEFREELEKFLDSMDQPTIDGINSYFVSKAAASAGLKVAVSGLGGDELFGGYESFRQIPRLVRALGLPAAIPGLGRAFRLATAPFLKHFTSPKYAGLLEYGGYYGGAYLLRHGLFMPWELPALLDAEMVREGWRELQTIIRLEQTIDRLDSPRSRISALELQWYMRNQLLRDTDWASMAHSLEVRVPLVDLTLLRQVSRLRINGEMPGKADMAATPRIPLPTAIRERKKTGFGVPVRDWLLDDGAKRSRGLRGWAVNVYEAFVGESS